MLDSWIEFFAQPQVLIALGGLFVVLLLLVVFSRIRRSRATKVLRDLEVEYNQAKSVPLPFKLNKAIALSKSNDGLFDAVASAQDEYQEIDKQLKRLSIHLADIEDAILLGKVKQADEWSIDAKEMLDQLNQEVSALDQKLASILEDETQQRSQITKLKDEFRLCKSTLANNAQQLSHSMQTLQDEVAAIEKMFTSFEEWMYASEFDKAKEKANEIEENIAVLKNQLETLPTLISLCKGTLPTLIDEVAYLFNQNKQKGVHVDHLDVTRNVELISSTLKDDLTQLRNGISEHVLEHTQESEKRLKQLKSALEHEARAFDESNALLHELSSLIEKNKEDYANLSHDVEHVGFRYGLKGSEQVVEALASEIEKYQSTYSRLEALLDDRKVPATTISLAMKETIAQLNKQRQTLTSHLNQFTQAKSDEARAKKQLLKLHLIGNEIKVKIKKHRLPAISDSYQGDVGKSKQMTATISAILNTDPLDTNRLNTLVNEAIDFTYKLYNNVNNIVGMVDMIEHGIVFANKYRSSIPSMDSDLSRTELSFRNGEYTQALSIVLGAIEKIHPESFEQLVKDNAKSAAGV